MKVFSATDAGRIRSVNQDFIFTSTDPVGNLPNLFVVADGMGGHNAGDFASHYGVSTMVETIRKDANFNPVKIIRNGITAANAVTGITVTDKTGKTNRILLKDKIYLTDQIMLQMKTVR